MEDLFMRELTFEEMDQVAGGNQIAGAIIAWLVNKTLNYASANAGNYIDYLVHCWATYGAGPYDYRHIS